MQPRPSRVRLRALATVSLGALLVVGQPATAAPCRVGTPCEPTGDPPPRSPPRTPTTTKGSIFPKYYILAVVYAPPGANGGKGSSQVEYGSGSTAGTSTSSAGSFKAGLKVSASVGGGLFGGATITTEFETSSTTTDTEAIDIKKSATSTIRVTGGGSDGIDHDKDLIYLWLNPRVDVVRSGDQLAWSLGVAGPAMSIQYAYVGWLKHPQTMPPGLQAKLAEAGLGPADYPTILAADPFATGATTIAPERFVRVPTNIPYLPPYAAADPVPTKSYSQKSETTTTATQKVESEYAVGIGVGSSTEIPGLFKAELKTTHTFKWTSSNSAGRSAGANESATFTIGGPGYGYNGPTEIDVYWDTLYKTFLFAYAPPRPMTAHGTVVDARGKPVAGREVGFDVGGVVWRTFTDARGQFRFSGTATGEGRIVVGDKAVPIVAGPGAQVLIKLPAVPLRPAPIRLPR